LFLVIGEICDVTASKFLHSLNSVDESNAAVVKTGFVGEACDRTPSTELITGDVAVANGSVAVISTFTGCSLFESALTATSLQGNDKGMASVLVILERLLWPLVIFPRLGDDGHFVISSDIETSADVCVVLGLDCATADGAILSLVEDSGVSVTMCRGTAGVVRVGMRDVATVCEIDRCRSIVETSFARAGRVLNVTGVSSMSKLDTALDSAADEVTMSTVMSSALSPQQYIII